MKAIRLSGPEEFEQLLDHITGQAHRANDYWYLFESLKAEIDEYPMEMNEAPVFFGFTLNALRDVVLSMLGRLYDQHSGAFSLRKFLLTIKEYPRYFSEEQFRRRLKDNPHVESLTEHRMVVDAVDLENELLSVSDTDSLVSRLVGLRNKYVAHIDPRHVLGNIKSLNDLPTE